jgi:hypothetical protein
MVEMIHYGFPLVACSKHVLPHSAIVTAVPDRPVAVPAEVPSAAPVVEFAPSRLYLGSQDI